MSQSINVRAGGRTPHRPFQEPSDINKWTSIRRPSRVIRILVGLSGTPNVSAQTGTIRNRRTIPVHPFSIPVSYAYWMSRFPSVFAWCRPPCGGHGFRFRLRTTGCRPWLPSFVRPSYPPTAACQADTLDVASGFYCSTWTITSLSGQTHPIEDTQPIAIWDTQRFGVSCASQILGVPF